MTRKDTGGFTPQNGGTEDAMTHEKSQRPYAK
jgi:hypothetical protein